MLMAGCQAAQLTRPQKSSEENEDEPADFEGDKEGEGSEEY